MLKDLISILGKDSGLIVADDGLASAEFSGWLDTGSYSLNALFSGSIYGGIPNNKVTGLAGESATGKTFFALGLCASFQRVNPTGVVVYFDSEAAVTKKMMQDHGLDPKRVAISEPESIQDFKTKSLKFLQAYEELDHSKRMPVMFVLDSLGMLPTSKEIEDAAEGSDKRDMTRSPQIRSVFRTLTLKLAQLKIPMIVTNHTYEVVGAYVPTKEMCMTEDALLITKDGVKKISDITTDDEVLSQNGQYQPVLETYNYKECEVYEVEFEDGTVLTCTGAHKFLINNNDEWKAVEDLNMGDDVAHMEFECSTTCTV